MKRPRLLASMLLAAISTISCHDAPTRPVQDPGEPIDSKILVTLSERLNGRSLLMRCRTERVYGCINYQIEFSTARWGSTVMVNFRDITIGGICFTAIGPATCTIDLGSLSPGTYPLVFGVRTGTTKANLIVTNDAYTIVPIQAGGVSFPSPVLRRIPDGTIWGLMGSLVPPYYPGFAEFDTLANAFLDSLAAHGAEPAALAPGNYGAFQIDSTGTLQWPGITGYYFSQTYVRHYSGTSGPLHDLVDYFGRTASQSISIQLYTWRGEWYASWLAAPAPVRRDEMSERFDASGWAGRSRNARFRNLQ